VYSERLLDHFQNPRNVGELEGAVVVEMENPACGDVLRLSARVERGCIAEVRYKVRGCTASIACGSALTEILLGMGVGELSGVDAARIASAVGGLSLESRHAAVLCADAVAALRRTLA
jgi:nitrogen fixation NifU-like protein